MAGGPVSDSFTRLSCRLDIAEVEMPGLMACRKEFGPAQPLKGVRVTGSLHMTIQVRTTPFLESQIGTTNVLLFCYLIHLDHWISK